MGVGRISCVHGFGSITTINGRLRFFWLRRPFGSLSVSREAYCNYTFIPLFSFYFFTPMLIFTRYFGVIFIQDSYHLLNRKKSSLFLSGLILCRHENPRSGFLFFICVCSIIKTLPLFALDRETIKYDACSSSFFLSFLCDSRRSLVSQR